MSNEMMIQKGKDTKLEFVNGFARTTMLPGAYPDVDVNKCVLKAGHSWEPELYNFEDKVQVFFFAGGKGYIGMPNEAFTISEPAVFVPYFDNQKFIIKAGEDYDLEFLQFVCKQTDFDKKAMNTIRTTLPRFKLMSECETYEEPFKGPGTKSPILIQYRLFGKFSMGATTGKGPNYVGQHVHPDLVQWYYILPGSRLIYTAGGKTVEMVGGDLSFTNHNVSHGSIAEEGDVYDYVWFEVAYDGFQP